MGKELTLREAFGKFHRENSRIDSDTEISNDSEIFFNCHDIAHVIFECDTSLRGEGIVKLWTIFGTTLGFVNHIKEYAGANAYELFRQYSLKHILANIPKVIVAAPVVITRAQKMKKKWPWTSYEKYLDVSLNKIRKEFNIVPIGRSYRSQGS